MGYRSAVPRASRTPPGLRSEPSRLRPRLHWELLVCGSFGHEMVGLDATELREQDALYARVLDGVRWHRCLRCDSWLAVPPPAVPARRHPPERAEIDLPLRGRPLRDKIILRLIAVNRAVHFLVLGGLGAALAFFVEYRPELQDGFTRVLADLQGGAAAADPDGGGGILGLVDEGLSLPSSELDLYAAALLVYAVVEGVEAVGLWLGKRWAEYLTLLVTASLLPVEVYELTEGVTPFKVTAFVINVAVVVYLLFAKRLFGLRGGPEAEERLRAADVGWGALELAGPESQVSPARRVAPAERSPSATLPR